MYAYNQRKENSTGATYFNGGRPLPNTSNLISLIYICDNINFIDAWINTFERNIAWRCLAYQDKNIPPHKKKQITKDVKNPTPEYFKRKHQTWFIEIGGEWFMNQMKNSKPPIRIPRLTEREKITGKIPRKIERDK